LPQYIEEHYAPEWLPESYVIDPEMTEDYDLSYVLTFSNDDGDEILFSQYTIDSTNIGINTEGVETVTVSINGHQGLMYSNQGVQTIVWNNHKYGFTLSGSLAMEK
ncbi:MAG: DUF4367 domain-containing protein, partial [Oscillospiraceae bacterium]|nr:DUF4367 domain-containing protein [Oscillospiraceae bacterium]